MDFKISREELYRWCSIPWQDLEKQPDLKTKLVIKEDRASMMSIIGNMMADEVIQHNAEGKLTKWVLPAGPTDEYDIFIDRVNKERISLKNLWVFHMDDFLDWEGRPFPVGDTYESLEGTMNACFTAASIRNSTCRRTSGSGPVSMIWTILTTCARSWEASTPLWAGVGCKGLVAFCEPPRRYSCRLSIEEYANSKTRVVDLNEDTIVALSQRTLAAATTAVPPKAAVTLGFKTMLSASGPCT